MKKSLILIQLFLLLSFSFSSAIAGSDNAMVTNSSNTEQTNHTIVFYVIGSGGVMGATGTNYIHFATAGETVVGGMQSANHLLLSGYWHTGIFRPTAVEQKENAIVPETFELRQNYPNPFNPQTTIEYDLAYSSKVTVEIYNLVGQRIRLLLNSQNQGAGFRQVVWDGRNDQGMLIGSGVYLYRITISKANPGNQGTEILFQQTQKMLFVK